MTMISFYNQLNYWPDGYKKFFQSNLAILFNLLLSRGVATTGLILKTFVGIHYRSGARNRRIKFGEL